jgi:rubrerythrin
MEQEYCEALKFAIDFEQEGRKLYLDSIERVKDPFAKRTLAFLADEESHHIEKIEKFNEALLGRGEFDVQAECRSDLPERVKEYVGQVVQEEAGKVSPESSDIKIYELALDMESASYKAYRDAFEENSDEKLRRFFEFLMHEEQIHYDLLDASKKYLADPSYYFEEFGGWIFG